MATSTRKIELDNGTLTETTTWEFAPKATPPPPPPPDPAPIPIPTPTPTPAPTTGVGAVVLHRLGRTYVPASATAGLRGVCLWGRLGAETTAYQDWSSTPELEAWRQWAERERVALVGLFSGGSIQTAAELAAEVDDLRAKGAVNANAVPWLLRGFSFSGMRAWNITTQAPERVAAFSWDSGDPLQDDWSRTWNGETVPPNIALWPNYQGKWDQFYTPTAAALKVPGLLTIGGAEQLYRKSIDFLWRLGRAANAPWNRQEIPGRGHTYTDNGELERALFSRALSGNTPIPVPVPVPTPTPTPTPIPGPINPGGFRVLLDGKRFVTEGGSLWVGRGANLPDHRSCNACTYVPRELALATWHKRADALFGPLWGANFARLNLSSVRALDGRRHGLGVVADPQYLDEIETMVSHIATKHPQVQLLVNLFSDPSFIDRWEPTAATVEPWRLIAKRLAKYPGVWFGLVNEITDSADKVLLRQNYEALISTIRAVEVAAGVKPHIITVQGHGGWARCFDDYIAQPFADKQVAYERHVYEGAASFMNRQRYSNRTPLPEMLQALPTFVGEFGPDESIGMDLTNCRALIDYAEPNSLSYLSWIFHMRCGTNCNMFVDSSSNGCGDNMSLVPTEWGRMMQDAFARNPR